MHCGGVGPLSLSERVGKLQCKANELSVFLIFACIPHAWQERVNLIKINGEKEWDKSQYEYSLCLYASTACAPACTWNSDPSKHRAASLPSIVSNSSAAPVCRLLPPASACSARSGVVRRGQDDTAWCA